MSRKITPEEFDALPIGSLLTQVYWPAEVKDWDSGLMDIWPAEPIWRHIVKSSDSWPAEVAFHKTRKFRYYNVIRNDCVYLWDRLCEGEMFFSDFWTGHPGCEIYVEGE